MAAEVNALWAKLKHKHHNYFEGNLQLRNVTQDMVNWVYAAVVHDKRALIVKEEIVPNGIDLYMTSQKYLQILGKRMKTKFGGELRISSSLHTKSRTGKDLFRVTVLYRLASYKRGDIVQIDEERFEIMKVDSKVHVKSLSSGKRSFLSREIVEYHSRK